MFGLSKPIHELQKKVVMRAVTAGVAALFAAIGLFWVTAAIVQGLMAAFETTPPAILYLIVGLVLMLPAAIMALQASAKKQKKAEEKRATEVEVVPEAAAARSGPLLARRETMLGPQSPLVTIGVALAAGVIAARFPASHDILRSLLRRTVNA